jgi:hypothetical protein
MLHRVALARTDVSENLVFLCSVRRLLVTASVVPSSTILVTVMKEALGSSETSALTRATRRDIPEDTILHSPVSCLKDPEVCINSGLERARRLNTGGSRRRRRRKRNFNNNCNYKKQYAPVITIN